MLHDREISLCPEICEAIYSCCVVLFCNKEISILLQLVVCRLNNLNNQQSGAIDYAIINVDNYPELENDNKRR